jgi:hypothetical protein
MIDFENNKYYDNIVPNRLNDEGSIYYNFKENLFRVNCGFQVSYYLKSTYKTNTNLIEYFDKFLKYLKTGSKLIFDGAIEPNYVYLNLKETWFLDTILEYVSKHNLPNDSIQIWSSDFGVDRNTPEMYHSIIKSMAKFKNYPEKAIDVNLLNTREFDKKFIILMNNPTQIRQTIYEFIKNNHDLENNSYYSFNSGGNSDEFDILHIERYLNQDLDKFKFSKNGAIELQMKSIIHIVSETQFWKNFETRMFSEKTFRPLNSCQPFILITHPYMLSKLKAAGFKTFDKWWDESYDIEEDDDVRIKKILTLIQDLNGKSIKELSDMYKEMIPTLKHNFYHLNSDSLPYEFRIGVVFDDISEFEQQVFI